MAGMKPAWLVALVIGVVTVSGCASTRLGADVPLEPQPITAPGADVPAELAAFSGRWVGVWTDGRAYRKNMGLMIERVAAPDRAFGRYGCGHALPKANPVCPSAFPVDGTLEGGVLRIAYPAIGAEGRYRIDGDSLRGEMVDATSGKLLIWVTATRLP